MNKKAIFLEKSIHCVFLLKKTGIIYQYLLYYNILDKKRHILPHFLVVFHIFLQFFTLNTFFSACDFRTIYFTVLVIFSEVWSDLHEIFRDDSKYLWLQSEPQTSIYILYSGSTGSPKLIYFFKDFQIFWKLAQSQIFKISTSLRFKL